MTRVRNSGLLLIAGELSGQLLCGDLSRIHVLKDNVTYSAEI